jgi:hypothetical protein
LLREAADYEGDDPARVFAMAECTGEEGAAMYASMTENHPELARQAIITAFLYKHQQRWEDDDQSLEQLGKNDEGEDEEDEEGMVSDDFTQIFDGEGERE